MSDLIERLEKASEGSRELDAEIWAVVNGRGQPMQRVGPPTYNPVRLFCNPTPEIDWIGYDLLNIAPAYTTSIDAALTLVPENCDWTIEPDGAWVRWMGADDVEEAQCVLSQRGGKCTALALCIAALRARGVTP